MATHEVVSFSLNGSKYCLSAYDTAHVARLTETLKMPNSPAFSEGVIELDAVDETVELLNPGRVFDIGEASDDGEMVLVLDDQFTENGRRLGWKVDDVESVTSVDRNEVDESVSQVGVLGLIEINDDRVLWIDPHTILSEVDYGAADAVTPD